MSSIWVWGGFLVLVTLLLVVDLFAHRGEHGKMSTPAALGWTAFWIAFALAFNVFVYFGYEHHWFGLGESIGRSVSGSDAAVKYFTAYIVEKSLSLDNIFVMAMIFGFFRVPDEAQHNVLYLGILGAVVMRGAMIYGGVSLMASFSWVTYIFGAILLATAFKMMREVEGHESDPADSRVIKFLRSHLPFTDTYDGKHFVTRVDGKRAFTPLMLALLTIEVMDLMFAVDSIPAVLAITDDIFIVYTSNIFAILGLRALYFALASVLERFQFITPALVAVLLFVGIKLLLSHVAPVPPLISLGVIAGLLTVGIGVSLVVPTEATPKVQWRAIWMTYVWTSAAIILTMTVVGLVIAQWRWAIVAAGVLALIVMAVVAHHRRKRLEAQTSPALRPREAHVAGP